MTAFYMFRLLFMTFFGESQSGSSHRAHHISRIAEASMTIRLDRSGDRIRYCRLYRVAGMVGRQNAFEHCLEPVFEPLADAACGLRSVEYSHGLLK